MKILHVIRCLDPGTGGPYSVIAHVVREQIRIGHDVTILATNVQASQPWVPAHTFAEEIAAEPDFCGAEIFIARAIGRQRPWSNFAFSREGSRWLRRRLSDPDRTPDIIHIHGTWSYILNFAASLARRHAIPYVLEPYGNLDKKSLETGSTLMKKVFINVFLQKVLRRAAFVHPASLFEANYLRRWIPEERLRIIPHGVDIPEFDPAESANLFLTKFPELKEKRILLFLGRIIAVKQPELLVEALARLREEYPDLVLLLVGNDKGQMSTIRATAEKLGVRELVTEIGFLRGELKQGAYAAATLFALPSLHENFGIAPVEAMAHGLPVLVSTDVGCHVYVERSGGGVVVEGNATGVTEGVRELLKADRNSVGQRGRDFVRQHLSWPAVIRQIDELYQDSLC